MYLQGVNASREAYEFQRQDARNAFAEFGSRDQPGKVHALDCHVVRANIEAAERFVGDPLGGHYAQRYPRLLTREEAQTPGRKRCTRCAPDVQEVKRTPRPTLSGLGWPLGDGSCARSPRLDWVDEAKDEVTDLRD